MDMPWALLNSEKCTHKIKTPKRKTAFMENFITTPTERWLKRQERLIAQTVPLAHHKNVTSDTQWQHFITYKAKNTMRNYFVGNLPLVRNSKGKWVIQVYSDFTVTSVLGIHYIWGKNLQLHFLRKRTKVISNCFFFVSLVWQSLLSSRGKDKGLQFLEKKETCIIKLYTV